MTAPSQTPEAAGLEVVAWRWRFRTDGVWNYQEAQQRIPDVTCEPLVTAASAQARIVELEAENESHRSGGWILAEMKRRQEAEARADRLAKGMPDLSSVIGWLANGCDPTHAVTELRILQARINHALQQETRP